MKENLGQAKPPRVGVLTGKPCTSCNGSGVMPPDPCGTPLARPCTQCRAAAPSEGNE